MKKFLITFLLLISCSNPNSEPGVFVDNAFITHLNSFYEAGIKRGYNTPNRTTIRFVEAVEGQILGFCDLSTRTIYIDKNKWYNKNIHSQELIIWHEMAHCQLGKVFHNSNVDSYGCPISILFPELWIEDIKTSDYCKNFYYTHKGEYLDELFR